MGQAYAACLGTVDAGKVGLVLAVPLQLERLKHSLYARSCQAGAG